MYKPRVLYLHFYSPCDLDISSSKYDITNVNVWSKQFNSIISCKIAYDIIVLGGGKKGLPVATEIYKYIPLYTFLNNCKNTPALRNLLWNANIISLLLRRIFEKT